MGKVRIVGGGENGQYTVEVLHNRDRIDLELAYLAAMTDELTAQRDELQAEYDAAVIERNAAAAAVDEKIAQYIAGGSEGAPNVEVELIALAQASARVQSIDVNLTMVKGRLLQVQKRKEALDAIPKEQIQPAWCADYTEDLEGEVRSVEVPDEGSDNLLIFPGYDGGNSYSQARDGQLFWREGQLPYQAYFNAAILPGVQRWHPQFRFATIESVDKEAHTATIAYASMDSSAQGLLITDPLAKRTDVPIEYMQCHSAAFDEGDEVLVELQERDWQQPRIIGFRDNPKPCSIIMAYNLGFRFLNQFYDDADPTGYPPNPGNLWRNRGVKEVTVKLWGGDSQALLYATNLGQVESATVISEMPAFAASGIITRDEIVKGSFVVPTTTLNRNAGPIADAPDYPIDVPWLGTKDVGGAVFPINKPPDPFVLEPEELRVTFRQYRQSFQFYDMGTFGRVRWSDQVDVEQKVGEVEVTCVLEEFPTTIEWEEVVYTRKAFVNFVPFDFDNDRGEAGPWQLDRICIRYDPQ